MVGECTGFWLDRNIRFFIYHRISKEEAAEESKEPVPFEFNIGSFLKEEKLSPIKVLNCSGNLTSRTVLCTNAKNHQVVY